MVMQRQNQAILNNPGTLAYTPASSTPAAAVAPWNSWLQPNCAPGRFPAAAAAIGGSSPAAGMIPDSSPPAAVQQLTITVLDCSWFGGGPGICRRIWRTR